MADHSKPTNTSLYSNYTTELDARFDDLAQGLDPAVTTATNIPTNSIRWNSANSYWEKWNGTVWSALDTGYEIDLAGARKILTNSASPALTITQTGSGNAFVVEDSASADATPFVIDATGQVVVGNLTSIANTALEVVNSITRFTYSNNAFSGGFSQRKSRATAIGSKAIVQTGDTLGNLFFYGDDGATDIIAASIAVAVDGTPGLNDMPGRLVFSTTPDGGATPLERMRIDNAGRVGIGGTPSTNRSIHLLGNSAPVSGGVSYSFNTVQTIQSDLASGSYSALITSPAVVDSAFTLSTLNHYNAAQGTFGASASVTNQYGFNAQASLTGATNNYGFYGGLTSGTGRWNFYAVGTADNYFAGDVGIGVTAPAARLDVLANTAGSAVRITQTGTGNAFVVEDSASPDTSPFVIDATGQIISGAVAATNYPVSSTTFDNIQAVEIQRSAAEAHLVQASFNSATATVGSTVSLARSRGALGAQGLLSSGDTIGRLQFLGSDGQAVGTGAGWIRSAVIEAVVDATPTNGSVPARLTFSTTPSGSATPVERMRIDSVGGVGIGSAAGVGVNVVFSRNITGSTTAINHNLAGVIQPDVTGNAYYSRTTSQTAANGAIPYTMGGITHYYANQGTFNADSTVNFQYGFSASSGLVGAINNYGFHSNIPSGTGRFNLYMAGTADNYLAGNLGIGAIAGANERLRITSTLTATDNFTVINNAAYGSGATFGSAYTSQLSIPSGALTNVTHFRAEQTAFVGTAVNQFGFAVASGLTGATNNYGFYGNIPAGTGHWNFYAGNTASNYFAGNTGVGGVPANKFDVVGGTTRLSRAGTAATAMPSVDLTLLSGINTSNVGTPQLSFFSDRSDRYSSIGHYRGASSNVIGLSFFTDDSAGNQVEKLRIDSGNVLVTSPAGLGYGTGAGGSVTQATSKVTAVTLNKPTGAITSAADALGAGVEVAFVLTNSLIAGNDIVIVNSASGSYSCRIRYSTVGSCQIAIKNETAGSLSTAVGINFAIIKGATA